MDTELGMENVGYGLLKKMGWKGEGQGLGVEGDGQSSSFFLNQTFPFPRIEGFYLWRE